jgi:ADP-dependent NAD(P)H-hydrate dehydratase / NAD(P)H-hydrate epimerase
LSLKNNIILTPHPGEAARLLKISTAEVQADRINAALSIAKRAGAIVVLKGAGTIIATPDGDYFINTTGNPGMASGGMGDALSGMIAAFLALGLTPLNAAKLGVYLHGAAADCAAHHGMGPNGLTASEVIFEARTLLNTGLHDEHD